MYKFNRFVRTIWNAPGYQYGPATYEEPVPQFPCTPTLAQNADKAITEFFDLAINECRTILQFWEDPCGESIIASAPEPNRFFRHTIFPRSGQFTLPKMSLEVFHWAPILLSPDGADALALSILKYGLYLDLYSTIWGATPGTVKVTSAVFKTTPDIGWDYTIYSFRPPWRELHFEEDPDKVQEQIIALREDYTAHRETENYFNFLPRRYADGYSI